MIGKVYPEGEAWIDLAREYVSEFKDLAELEEHWKNIKETHKVLSVFPETVEKLMSYTFRELINVYERYQKLPRKTKKQSQRAENAIDRIPLKRIRIISDETSHTQTNV